MAVYDRHGNELDAIYDRSGESLNYGYDADGNIVFQKEEPYVPEVLTSFEIFYPDDADSTYEASAGKYVTLTSDEFLALKYDGYVSSPPSGVRVTKTSLGKDSTGQYDIWEYDFKPVNAKRKILLMSGEHAYETTASFGLAHLIKHIYRIRDNDAFAYIRKYVEIKVVPVFNPWGYNQTPKEYPVYGNINPERNFDFNGLWAKFSDAGNYWNKKGAYPFQTAETRILAKWHMDNQDMDFLINCHTGEERSDYDNWIDYMVATPIVSAILAGLEKNEAEFQRRFGQKSRTYKLGTVYPSSTGYGMHGSFNMFCVPSTGFTMEQAPQNTIFGNGKSNSAGAINNYASVTATYIMEMLLDKYQSIYDSIHPSDDVPITGISGAENITFESTEKSHTVMLEMTPSDSTQFLFDWVSSDTSVCEVWGQMKNAVLVKKGTGTATITVTNRKNRSVSTSFTVTVTNG